MSKYLKYSLMLCILYMMVALIFSPDICINAGRKAVFLCLETVIPSLFPFFVCSGLFSALGVAALCSRYLSPLMRPLFGVPGSGAMAFLLGIVSGYPTGAACVADLYRTGNCTKTEAQRMTAFCNNSGPLFIIGVVGVGILGSARIGYYLYFSHILSALITGILLNLIPKTADKGQLQLPPSVHNSKNNTALTLGSVIDNSVFSMLKVCAFILIFSVIGAALPQSAFTPFLYALLEITGGIREIAALQLSPIFVLSLISFFTAFSGISILLQVGMVISPCGLSVKPYFFGKLLQGVLAFIISYLLFSRFPVSKPAFADNTYVLAAFVQPQRLLLASLLTGIICAASVILLCLFAKILERLGH